MSQKIQLPKELVGLTDDQVIESRKINGRNVVQKTNNYTGLKILLGLLKEPMLILLIGVSIIYLLLGQNSDAYFMIFAIVVVSGISFYQDRRSQTSLLSLESLNVPLSQVIRKSELIQIPTPDIVPGDLVMNEEGSTLQADGDIAYSHDFSINESSLTGESIPANKSEFSADKKVYQGTSAASGLVVYRVTATGSNTKLGKLGKSLLEIKEERSPLQVQIDGFVRRMTLIGILIFLLLWGFNFNKTRDLLASLLEGLTLAMAILPEEIPVAFTTFMAIGAWKLMKKGIIIKKMQTVEALGSTTVVCTDKTGTITENRMTFAGLYVFQNDSYYSDDTKFDAPALTVLETAMWSSEPIPFDPMEKTIHQLYEKHFETDQREFFKLIHEYPLSGIPPMMTHVHENKEGQRIIAAKGAPETMMRVSDLTQDQKQQVNRAIDLFTKEGYRVLGVATTRFDGNSFPGDQEDFKFSFDGLIAFFDPPKPGIHDVFNSFYQAGLQVKVFTGDNARTTTSIAKLAGIGGFDKHIDGEDLMRLPPGQFQQAVRDNILFSRMFPEAKLAAVESLKKDHQVVAMLGDGINDGPALKSAHIGIAMGRKGTEIARNAAALVLVKDDLSTLIDGIAAGRRIYTNLKKAIQYIISIHIPIILTVALPLLLGWIYPVIFMPIHVIFLELIMGPTCSIAYENEPMEKNAMLLPPRKVSKTFFQWKELTMSMVQGLFITAGILFMYQFEIHAGATENEVRTAVFITLIASNILLTLVNRSFYYSFLATFRYRNRLLTLILMTTLLMLGIILIVPFIRDFFRLAPASFQMILMCLAVSMISVLWIEIVKWRRRSNH
jgi:Ca2+-transporting ATPase